LNWIAISDGRRAIRASRHAVSSDTELLSVGSLVVEFTFAPTLGHRHQIIAMDRHHGWTRKFSLSIGMAGDLQMRHQQGNVITGAQILGVRADPEDVLRLTLAWHAPQRLGFMVLENLTTGTLTQSVVDAPHPWSMDDVDALIGVNPDVRLDPSITMLAVSDRIEPVGLNGGLAAGTWVDTIDGPKSVEHLLPGDLVQTMGHGFQPLRFVMIREVPAFGSFAPIRLRAPFFGLDHDLVVSPEYRLLISGADAEYLFGTDSVLVEARYLATMAAYARVSKAATVKYVHLVLDAHVCLSMQGAWGESLYLGDLAEQPARHAISPLASVPRGNLPVHTFIDSPELRSYEAMVLVSALCA
jgi:hypothetical protein